MIFAKRGEMPSLNLSSQGGLFNHPVIARTAQSFRQVVLGQVALGKRFMNSNHFMLVKIVRSNDININIYINIYI